MKLKDCFDIAKTTTSPKVTNNALKNLAIAFDDMFLESYNEEGKRLSMKETFRDPVAQYVTPL